MAGIGTSNDDWTNVHTNIGPSIQVQTGVLSGVDNSVISEQPLLIVMGIRLVLATIAHSNRVSTGRYVEANAVF